MPTEIVPGVFDITCRERDGRRYRVFLFEHDVPTIVDAGFADTVSTVTAALDDINIVPERLVITHADGDHIGGFDGLLETYDLETWVPEQSTLDTDHDPDYRYGDGDRIGAFTAVHVPGHEADNHALIDEGRGVAVLGDALSGADQRGLPSGWFHLPPAVYSHDLNEAEAHLPRLLEYDFDVGLVFHGSNVLEGASEKLDAYVFDGG